MSEKNSFSQKHSELWKFIKFSFAGAASSAAELIVHLILTRIVFKSFMGMTFRNPFFNYIGIDNKGYLYSYLISITVGYTLAFIINRKVTFKSDANYALSVFLYVIMVIFTIIAGSWIGTSLSGFAVRLAEKGISQSLVDAVCKIIQMAVPTLWTYPLNRFVIHRKKEGS